MKTSCLKSFSAFALVAVLSLGISAAAQQPETRVPAPAKAVPLTGKHVKVEGMITERNGDRLTLKLASSQSLAVELSGLTQVREKKNNFLRKGRKYRAEQLTPGLAVEVEGSGGTDGTLLADKILVTNDDLKMAQALNARVEPVEENQLRMSGQVGELNAVSNAAKGGAKAAQETADSAHARIAALDDYDVVHTVTIRFKVGSAVLSEDARKSLDDLAQEAVKLKGFVLEVAGFASSEGNRAFNQRLSRQRAEAVSEYLAEKDDVPLRRIMTPTGLGVSHPVSDNSTRTGRQENRRVEVRLMVSRGITSEANTVHANATGNKETAAARPDQPR